MRIGGQVERPSVGRREPGELNYGERCLRRLGKPTNRTENNPIDRLRADGPKGQPARSPNATRNRINELPEKSRVEDARDYKAGELEDPLALAGTTIMAAAVL